MKPPAKGKPPPDNPRISSIGADRGWPDTPTVQNGSQSPAFAGVQLAWQHPMYRANIVGSRLNGMRADNDQFSEQLQRIDIAIKQIHRRVGWNAGRDMA